MVYPVKKTIVSEFDKSHFQIIVRENKGAFQDATTYLVMEAKDCHPRVEMKNVRFDQLVNLAVLFVTGVAGEVLTNPL